MVWVGNSQALATFPVTSVDPGATDEGEAGKVADKYFSPGIDIHVGGVKKGTAEEDR
jgi:hypothetical protein